MCIRDSSNLVKLYNYLPNEYLQFEGKTLNNWNIKQKNEIYSIQTNVGELFCIAQRLDEFICLAIENKKLDLFYIQDHESEPTLLNKTFGESIKNI